MRIGEIEKTTLAEFAYYVKETFNEEGIRVVGDLDKNSRNRLKLDEDQKAFIKTLKFVLKNELLAKD